MTTRRKVVATMALGSGAMAGGIVLKAAAQDQTQAPARIGLPMSVLGDFLDKIWEHGGDGLTDDLRDQLRAARNRLRESDETVWIFVESTKDSSGTLDGAIIGLTIRF